MIAMHPTPVARRRGVALLLVVIVLAALATLAVPFATSMRQQDVESRRFHAELRARGTTSAAIDLARGHLASGVEARESEAAARAPFDTPGYDGEEEVHSLELNTPLRGGLTVGQALGVGEGADGLRTLLSIGVEDESGKVDLNSASPWLLGNLFASTVTVERADSQDTSLQVEPDSTFAFPSAGFLLVQGEIIRYSRKTPDSFEGLERGAQLPGGLFSTREARRVPEGTLIVDARALVVAKLHLMVDAAGHTRPLHRATELRSADLAAAGAGVFSAEEMDSILGSLTVHGGRYLEKGWYAGQPLAAEPEAEQNGGWTLPIDQPIHYGRGSAVRITQGEERRHGHVVDFRPNPQTGTLIPIVDVSLAEIDHEQALVEVEERAPININTAPLRVLVACFLGVSSSRDSVSLEEAFALAQLVQERRRSSEGGLKGLEDFRAILNELESDTFSHRDRQALFLNAQCADHVALRVGTAPLCFRSFDRYTVDASTILVGTGQREVAAHREREVALVAWPGDVTWRLESQAQFREFAGRFSWLNLMATGPTRLPYETPDAMLAGHHFIPYDSNTFPSTDRERGYVQLIAAREQDGEQDQVLLEHFGGLPDDAFRTRALSGYTLGLGALFKGGGPTAATTLAPGRLEFWLRPEDWQSSGQAWIFDMGETLGRNHLGIYYDDQRDWLVFRMADASSAYMFDSFQVEPLEAYAEVRFPMDGFGLTRQRWHHIAIEWQGTGYGEMALLVDGVAHLRGEGGPFAEEASDPGSRTGFTYVVEGEDRSPLTFLASDLSESGELIQVQDSSGLPPRGSIRVGGEVILYDGGPDGDLSGGLPVVQGNMVDLRRIWWDVSDTPPRIYQGAQRGLWDSKPAEHRQGEPVMPAGYSAALQPWKPAGLLPPRKEGEPAPDPTDPVTQVGDWDVHADPWTVDHSQDEGFSGTPPGGGIVADLDPRYEERGVFAGGGYLDPDLYTEERLGKGGNLLQPLAHLLDDEGRDRFEQLSGVTLPDPGSDYDPSGEDELDWIRVFAPGFGRCDLPGDDLVGIQPFPILAEDDDTLGGASPYTATRMTGSWPRQGYAVLMRVTWRDSSTMPGMGRGPFGGAGGMCMPYVDAYGNVAQAVMEALAELGIPVPPVEAMQDKAFEYVRYDLDEGGMGSGGEEGGPGGGASLALVERGLFGTEPLRVELDPAQVPYPEVWAFPISVAVAYDDSQIPVYHAYPPSGYLQVEDEWIQYYFYRHDPSRRRIDFICPIWEKIIASVVDTATSVIEGGGQLGPGSMPRFGNLMASVLGTNRGQAGTLPLPHPRPNEFAFKPMEEGATSEAELEVIPAFRVLGDVAAPWDWVTLVEGMDPDLIDSGWNSVFQLHWRYNPSLDGSTWVAPTHSLGRSVIAGGRSRLLRFPAGETPELHAVPVQVGSGSNLPGGAGGPFMIGPVLGTPTPVALHREPYLSTAGAVDLSQLEVFPPTAGPPDWCVAGLLDEVRLRSRGSWVALQNDRRVPRLLGVELSDPGVTPGSATDPGATDLYVDVTVQEMIDLVGDTDGGVVKIGDEFIAFRALEAAPENPSFTVLRDCQRSFLGPVRNRGQGLRPLGDLQPVQVLRFADLTQLDQAIAEDTALLPVISSKQLRRSDGFVLVDDEIIGYTLVGSTVLHMPKRVETEEGLYRGRFGTERRGHASGAIVYELPFRYWDRYAENADDPSLATVQVACSHRSARWRGFGWEEEVPGSFLDLVCLLRMDGAPGWGEPPTNQPGGLYRFDSPEQDGTVLPSCDQLELRFMMRYLEGAYTLSHDWKETPRLGAVHARYRAQPRVLDHEEPR